MTRTTDTDYISFYTSAATVITKHPPLDLSHRLKERQAWFGGVAAGSPRSTAGVHQVEGEHHGSPERALRSPGATPPSRPPSATSERRHRTPRAAPTSDQARPTLTHQGPCASGWGLRNNAGTS